MNEVLVIKLTPKLKDAAWHEARAYEAQLLRTEAMFRAYLHTNANWLPLKPQPFAVEIRRFVQRAELYLRDCDRLQHGRTTSFPFHWRWTWTYHPQFLWTHEIKRKAQ